MNKKMKLLSVLGLVTAILFLFSPMVTAQSLSICDKRRKKIDGLDSISNY